METIRLLKPIPFTVQLLGKSVHFVRGSTVFSECIIADGHSWIRHLSEDLPLNTFCDVMSVEFEVRRVAPLGVEGPSTSEVITALIAAGDAEVVHQ